MKLCLYGLLALEINFLASSLAHKLGLMANSEPLFGYKAEVEYLPVLVAESLDN